MELGFLIIAEYRVERGCFHDGWILLATVLVLFKVISFQLPHLLSHVEVRKLFIIVTS